MIRRMAGFGLLAFGYTSAAAFAVLGESLLFTVVAALIVLAESYLMLRVPNFLPSFIDTRLGLHFRLISLDLMVALLGSARFATGPRVGLVVAAVATLIALRLTFVRVSENLHRRTDLSIGWRSIPGLPDDSPRRWQPREAAVRVAPLSLLLPVGMIVVEDADASWPVIAAAVLAIGALLAAIATVLRRESALGDITTVDRREEVRKAVAALQPEVVIYFGGPESSTHVIDVWLPILQKLDRQVLIIVRDRWHLSKMRAGTLPALLLPKNTDVEYFAVPSIRVALYPTNIAVNNHLIRVPGIFDVFVGHGDSDKGGSATPISRIFDEVWVAGKAGADRYAKAQVGVCPEQIREVGRPQLAEISRRKPAALPAGTSVPAGTPAGTEVPAGTAAGIEALTTVLYAPTWEGFYESWSYSSVKTMGFELVSRLLAMDRVRVVYKPHPAAGSRNAAVAREDRRIRELIRAAGAPHAVVTSLAGLYESFNAADILVSDISSVVTDFLYSRKPYIVCNPGGLEHSVFRQQFPSTAAAALLDPSCTDLAGIVEDARGPDVRAAARIRTSEYLLGASDIDPIERFSAAIDAAVALQNARTASLTARPEPEPEPVAPSPRAHCSRADSPARAHLPDEG